MNDYCTGRLHCTARRGSVFNYEYIVRGPMAIRSPQAYIQHVRILCTRVVASVPTYRYYYLLGYECGDYRCIHGYTYRCVLYRYIFLEK